MAVGIGEVLGGILAVLTALPIFKKKPYCIWVKTEAGWSNRNPGGNSARRCDQAVAELLKHGIPAADIMILPKGVTP